MPSVIVNDIEMYYEEYGEGDPLLLIAGIASDIYSWSPIIGNLKSRYKVIAFDSRCCGRTTPNPVKTTRDLLVSDIIHLLDFLGLQEVNVYGHSMGSLVAWSLVHEHPNRVKRLVVTSGQIISCTSKTDLFRTLSMCRDSVDEDLWFRLFYRFMLSDDYFKDPGYIDSLLGQISKYEYKQSNVSFLTQIDALDTFDYKTDINSIKSKILSLTGSNDILFSPAMQKSVYSIYSNIETQVIEDAAHLVHWEQPGRIVGHIEEFFA